MIGAVEWWRESVCLSSDAGCPCQNLLIIGGRNVSCFVFASVFRHLCVFRGFSRVICAMFWKPEPTNIPVSVSLSSRNKSKTQLLAQPQHLLTEREKASEVEFQTFKIKGPGVAWFAVIFSDCRLKAGTKTNKRILQWSALIVLLSLTRWNTIYTEDPLSPSVRPSCVGLRHCRHRHSGLKATHFETNL